jgi:hypothetical protein
MSFLNVLRQVTLCLLIETILYILAFSGLLMKLDRGSSGHEKSPPQQAPNAINASHKNSAYHIKKKNLFQIKKKLKQLAHSTFASH